MGNLAVGERPWLVADPLAAIVAMRMRVQGL